MEKDFQSCYYKELYSTKNIHTVGWIDISKPEFLAMAKSCLGIVFPSCSEGMNGGVITCMHASLIPVVSGETGVDVDSSHGVLLKTCSVQEIQAAVRGLSLLEEAQLAAMARKNWELARAKHRRETFSAAYTGIVSQIMAGEMDKSRAVVAPSPNSRSYPDRPDAASLRQSSMKLVTIGIPVYERLQYLPRVLDVVTSQDYPSIELIVSDNGMNGGAVQEILKRHYPTARFRQNAETVDIITHFNQIVHQASGDYYVPLQDDDEISSNYVSELVKLLERYPQASFAMGVRNNRRVWHVS